MTRLPVIAIVGRPNVGKSSLLNALTGKRISIVQDLPGVTRDRVQVPMELDGHWVELVDTGGYGFVDPDQLTEHIAHQIELAMARANLVLFLVDTETGLTGADQEVASLLRRKGINALLVANKADGPKADVMLGDFARLGLGMPIGVSAMNGRNVDQVLAAIRDRLDLSDAPTEMPDPAMMVAIVGKRNAGKSTLVNSIAEIYDGEGDRVIVSEVPGTTRDSIDVRFEKDGKAFVVIDTAGVRKKRHMVTNDIEFYSFHRAQRSIRRADVVMLLIDAAEPVSEPDKKLAQYVSEQHKPVVLVVNKWDLAREQMQEQRAEGNDAPRDSDLMEQYREYLDEELKLLDYAPIAFVTAKEGKNVRELLNLAQHIFNQASQRISTSKLNDVMQQVLTERMPSTPRGQRPKVYYVTQTDVNPPTIVLFVNRPEYLNESYQRFVVNRFRELLPFDEVPIKLQVRGKGGPPTDSLDDAVHAKPGAPRRPQFAKGKGKSPPKRREMAKSKFVKTTKPKPKPAPRHGPKRGARPK